MTPYAVSNAATQRDLVPIITTVTKSGLSRLYGMTACSSTTVPPAPTAAVLPTPLHSAMRDEFDAWDRASDEGFMGFERAL
jgi:hypothetical protein